MSAPCKVFRSKYFTSAHTHKPFWVVYHVATGRMLHCAYWSNAMGWAVMWAKHPPMASPLSNIKLIMRREE